MCIAEVSSAKSARVALGSSRSLLLGTTGGSSQPMGTYSRRSELTSGRTRNGARQHVDVVERGSVGQLLRRPALAGAAIGPDGGDALSDKRQPSQHPGCCVVQGENPALAASQILAGSDEGTQEHRSVRLGLQQGGSLVSLEDVVAVVDGLGPRDQLAHPVHRAAFLAHDQVRIDQRAPID